MTEFLSKDLLKIDAGQAAVAQAWADGLRQKEIARTFGFKTGAKVCVAILLLIQKYYPESCKDGSMSTFYGATPYEYGDDRRLLAAEAVKRYCAMREMT